MTLMKEPTATCWTLIEGAAQGLPEERELFARHYGPVVRAYLLARWRGGGPLGDLDDALQDVFMECFKCGGVLEKAEQRRHGGFRAFLHGVTRNVASRFESRRGIRGLEAVPITTAIDDPELREDDLDRVFDRAWAASIVRQALEHQMVAADGDQSRERRVDLLRQRFHEGRPIREIAKAWGEDAALVHRDYVRARREFETSLREIVASHRSGEDCDDLADECRNLLLLLQ